MGSIPNFTHLMANHVKRGDDYTPENRAYASNICSCPRQLCYKWSGTPGRAVPQWKQDVKEIMWYYGRHADEEFGRALDCAGYLIDSQLRLSHLLPDGVGGRLDHVVNFGDGNRIHEHKTIFPNVHIESLPYRHHVYQTLWYDEVARDELHLEQPPCLTVEPAAGRGGPWIQFELVPDATLRAELHKHIDDLLLTLRAFEESDGQYLAPQLEKTVHYEGKEKLVYGIDYRCTTNYCDYAFDESTGDGPCMVERNQLELSKRRKHKENGQWVYEWEDTPAAPLYAAQRGVFMEEHVTWRLRAAAWRRDIAIDTPVAS